MTQITYDPEADAAYIFLKDDIHADDVAESHVCDVYIEGGAIILMFDSTGLLNRIEILGAAKVLPREALNKALRDPKSLVTPRRPQVKKE